jgi:ParB family chromosome partitioning protein
MAGTTATTTRRPRKTTGRAASPATPAAPPAMELVHLDPNTLTVRANVRLDPSLDKGFTNSIRDRGVIVPVQAYRNGDEIVVLRGERRTLAARETGRPTVPVILVDEQGDIDRIVEQLAENDHREGLTDKDHAAAYEQLALLGLTEGEIARKTRTPEPRVRAGLAAKRSIVASAALAKYDFLNLDQAAAVADFENDGDTVKALVAGAKTGQFDHVLQKARDDRARAKLKEETAAALHADGWAVIPVPKHGSRTSQIEYLKHGSKNLTPGLHKKCPGRAVFLTEDFDWPDTEEGRAAREKFVYSARVFSWRPVEVCRDPDQYGHKSRYGETLSGSAKPKPVAEMDEEEQRVFRERRRDTINSNKAWDSAVPVRHAWLKDKFLTRKAAPKSAAGFVAAALASSTHGSHVTTELENRSRLLCRLLGIEDPGYGKEWTSELQKLVAAATPDRAQVLTLGMMLCAFEAGTSRESWRTINEGTVRYLRFIESEGYVLSDVERRACGEDLGTDNAGDTGDTGEDEGAEEAAD